VRWPWFILLFLAIVSCAVAEMFIGSVALSGDDIYAALVGQGTNWEARMIVLQIRLPRALMAILSGAALSSCGLMMQTLFRNPLAGPSVLGITSGSSLAVAFTVMVGGAALGGFGVVFLAFAGAMGVLMLILLADRRTGNAVTLLIVGLMLSYLCSSLVSIIQLHSSATAVKDFVLWGFGSFDGVTLIDLRVLLPTVVAGLVCAFLLSHGLNGLLLGEEHARSLGLNVVRHKRMVLLCTGVLTALVTAYAGPIAFLGLAVPHVARALFKTSDHRILMPAVILIGACLALLCDLIRHLPAQGSIPLNAVTSMIGAPVVLWIMIKGRNWFSTV